MLCEDCVKQADLLVLGWVVDFATAAFWERLDKLVWRGEKDVLVLIIDRSPDEMGRKDQSRFEKIGNCSSSFAYYRMSSPGPSVLKREKKRLPMTAAQAEKKAKKIMKKDMTKGVKETEDIPHREDWLPKEQDG